MSIYQKHQQKERLEELRAISERSYKVFLAETPTVVDCQANYFFFKRDYFGADWDSGLTLEQFRYGFARVEPGQLVMQTVAENEQRAEDADTALREQLIAEIMKMFSSVKRNDEQMIRTKQNQIIHFTTEQLVAERDRIKEAQRLAKFTSEQLREQLARQAEASRPLAPVLPAEYTREVIRAMTSPELKKLVSTFGVTTVNARLQGHS